MALYGRTPNMLSPLTLSAAAANDTTGTPAGTARHLPRARGIALQSIVEGTALDCIRRAPHTRTQAPGEAMELLIGDLVDYYRPSAFNDVPGWKGPATVTDVSNIRHGTVSLRWHSHAIECLIQDTRHAL
eukprot:8978254-Lingulodinium_polyedra.AAC.1